MKIKMWTVRIIKLIINTVFADVTWWTGDDETRIFFELNGQRCAVPQLKELSAKHNNELFLFPFLFL